MLSAFRRRATFANICSCLALTIALSMGTAYAANTVRSKDIVNGQVKEVDLGANSVTGAKIKDAEVGAADLGFDSVGADQLQTDSVNATEIADDSIDGGEIVNDSLGSSDLASGSVGSSEISDGSITGTEVASNSISTSDLVGTDANGGISLGSGSIPVGQCKFFDISVPGAAVDQTVIISTRDTPPTGVILYGVGVPSADHVTMAACNFTGGTFPALSSFPIRTVTFG